MTGQRADCHYGDHDWQGGGACAGCGERLRCYCGAFVRADGIDAHLASGRCRVQIAWEQAEYDRLSAHLVSEAQA